MNLSAVSASSNETRHEGVLGTILRREDDNADAGRSALVIGPFPSVLNRCGYIHAKLALALLWIASNDCELAACNATIPNPVNWFRLDLGGASGEEMRANLRM